MTCSTPPRRWSSGLSWMNIRAVFSLGLLARSPGEADDAGDRGILQDHGGELVLDLAPSPRRRCPGAPAASPKMKPVSCCGNEPLRDHDVEVAGEHDQRQGHHQHQRLVAEHPAQAAVIGGAASASKNALGRAVEAVLARTRSRGVRNREHIIGVRVSETKAETTTATLTVIANSRNSRPMMPPMNSSGMNTAISEKVIETMVKPICPAPLIAASNGAVARLDVADDVLDHHDGVVHHEADRDRQRHQRQIVEAVAEQVHRRRRCRRAPAARSRSG